MYWVTFLSISQPVHLWEDGSSHSVVANAFFLQLQVNVRQLWDLHQQINCSPQELSKTPPSPLDSPSSFPSKSTLMPMLLLDIHEGNPSHSSLCWRVRRCKNCSSMPGL
ncbi:hypothetical protein SAY87_005354 [Trapa incisa]|uniref:Uncharacterized protein n=1 Tax=Trapa incisa TaxID=236973 RepID=A0AAN7K9X2_9MYRT|nr:hypothetical protein SAY87_005354 [Trapa incisa]